MLAGRMIEFDPDVRGGDGWRIARDILESGRALAQMHAIIEAQAGVPSPELGALVREVTATRRAGAGHRQSAAGAHRNNWPARRRWPAPASICCARPAMRVRPASCTRIHAPV